MTQTRKATAIIRPLVTGTFGIFWEDFPIDYSGPFETPELARATADAIAEFRGYHVNVRMSLLPDSAPEA